MYYKAHKNNGKTPGKNCYVEWLTEHYHPTQDYEQAEVFDKSLVFLSFCFFHLDIFPVVL